MAKKEATAKASGEAKAKRQKEDLAGLEVQMTVRLTVEEATALRKHAREEERSTSYVLRQALAGYMKS